jgi:hypothetical protein
VCGGAKPAHTHPIGLFTLWLQKVTFLLIVCGVLTIKQEMDSYSNNIEY